MSLKKIMGQRQFKALFWTQFLGALNDNLMKNALILLVTYRGVTVLGLSPQVLVAAASGIFILPFFLFSPLAGQLSDKFEKTRVLKVTKGWELLIMLVGAYGFLSEQYGFLLLVLFAMGIQAAFFGPAKYSLIPQIVKSHELMACNAYVESGTFLAILLGTIAGGLTLSAAHPTWVVSLVTVVLAISGLISALRMKAVPVLSHEVKIHWNQFTSLGEMWRLARENPVIFNSLVGISWFWFFGAGVLSVLPIYCKDFLHADNEVVTTFLAMFTIGIGMGSIVSEKWSGRDVKLTLVPIGALGMTLFLIDLFVVGPEWRQELHWREFLQQTQGLRLLFDFFAMSVFGGIFIVPLYAIVQVLADGKKLSRIIAANNVMNALFMVISSLTVMGFYALNLNFPQIFLAFAGMNLLMTLYLLLQVPEFRSVSNRVKE